MWIYEIEVNIEVLFRILLHIFESIGRALRFELCKNISMLYFADFFVLWCAFTMFNALAFNLKCYLVLKRL